MRPFAFGLWEWKVTGETYGYLPIIHLGEHKAAISRPVPFLCSVKPLCREKAGSPSYRAEKEQYTSVLSCTSAY